jgi:hypothetical protein
MRKEWPEQGELREVTKKLRWFGMSLPTPEGKMEYRSGTQTWVEQVVYYMRKGVVTSWRWEPVCWETIEEYLAIRDEWKSATFFVPSPCRENEDET